MKSDKFYKQKTKPDLQEKDFTQALPAKIGPYKIESLLNKGGMSLLYLGLHPETHQPIAIKVLLPKYVKNKEIAALFLKEAEIIKMANHPNIVRLYGEGEWEKGLYIAMEFIQGISLRQFIQHKSLTVKRALEIVLQVAYALCHLHAHGVIHRDLKPENILITETGEIKVIDFGIAQLKGEESSKKKLIGTPVYMSPEQKKNPDKLTTASDIYALGMIAYELVLGKLSHGIVHLSFLPKKLAEILGKAMEPDVHARYRDIVEFITEISQYIKTLSDEKGESPVEEISTLANSFLLPKEIPRWNQLEIGLAAYRGESSTGLYLDFFHFSDNCYCVVLAEPVIANDFSFLHSLILRGMVRMAMQQQLPPVKLAETLNELVRKERKSVCFGLSLLFLYPNKNLLSFISCGFSKLWHIPESGSRARSLGTPNAKIGEQESAAFLETVDNWEFGDCLILSSSKQDAADAEVNELFLLSTQHKAEKWLEKKKGEKTSAVVAIARMF